MGKKAEARAKRQEEERQKQAAKNAALAERLDPRQPKVAAAPANDAAPRVAPHVARALAEQAKQPRALVGSRLGHRVTWCVTKGDQDGQWSWGEQRAWQPHEWTGVIHPAFQHFAGLTWGEVDALSSDGGHKMHHGHELGDLIPEVQHRWAELKLGEYDSVFRFRLGGTRRAWGYILQAHFFMVWWDRDHSFYPTEA